MNSGLYTLAVSLLAGALIQATQAAETLDPVSFAFEVRPILAGHCFKCHGPDEKARKGKLRLDQPEEAYALRDAERQEAAVVPFHPERSQLCWRIATTNEDDRMPPAASHLTLSSGEKDLLHRWVKEGAKYTPHWAFVPVGDVAVPAVDTQRDNPQGTGVARIGNPIDSFVLARLQREGLGFSPEASRETLIRRLSFDLRGLPPSLQEIDEFLADSSASAYERLVDRLLASPAYGEQQAALWLDLARFADTYGYQNDVERDMSPWRDWVIDAFNRNLPYDQFVTWQLAGDLLPAASRGQIVATAFNRLHRQTNEGGSVEEEFRAEYVADRVATTGTAFLGLTIGCARCHDHKYDPLTQKDFYRMAAFFNNCDESGLYSHFTKATPNPTVLLYAEGQKSAHEALQQKILAAEADLVKQQADARRRFVAWSESADKVIPRAQPITAFAFEEIKGDTTPDAIKAGRSAALIDGPELASGKFGMALKFSGDNSAVCKGVGAFKRTSPFSFSLWLKPTEAQERAVVFHRSRAWTDSGSRGYELVLEEGRPTFSLIHFWPGDALKVRGTSTLPTNEWSHLALTYDGSSHASGVHLFLNGSPLPVEIVRDHLFKDILHRKEWGDDEVGAIELTLAGRFRDSGFKNGLVDEFRVFDRRLTPAEVALEAQATPGSPEMVAADHAGGGVPPAEARFAWYLEQVDEPYRASAAALREVREAENAFIAPIPELMVMSEMSPRRQTYVLKRGAYDSPGEPVEPDVPEKILPFSDAWPRNRLGLAKWMVSRNNPLTARVEVNRIWRTHFGRGLVETEEDFGTQGKLPTHPQLLDWLARSFMDGGWDVKALHKLLVTSTTYRQVSIATSELLAKDPENRLLARGPKHRLRAEEIRDNALAVSGLLSPRIGGRSARPYQPDGLWEEAGTGKHYTPDKGEGLFRRSLYTFWRRTAPPPSMVVFDAPTREVCTARRETTTTPLQALVLLNDPQFVEAARVLAERLLQQSSADLDARIGAGFRLTTGRQPAPRELAVLRRLYEEQLQRFQAEPASAEVYLKTGDHPADASLPPPQLAATAVLASALMNLDEFVIER